LNSTLGLAVAFFFDVGIFLVVMTFPDQRRSLGRRSLDRRINRAGSFARRM